MLGRLRRSSVRLVRLMSEGLERPLVLLLQIVRGRCRSCQSKGDSLSVHCGTMLTFTCVSSVIIQPAEQRIARQANRFRPVARDKQQRPQ